ncbi:MAG: YajG family lipoprotein [Pseudomonadota bacterium]
MKLIKTSLILLIIGLSSNVWAEETATISLSAPKDLAAKVCPAPLWDNPKVIWKGAQDERAQKALGLQTKRGQDPIQVIADPALSQIFDSALKDLLQACGLNFVAKGDSNTPALEAQINQFSAGVEKQWVTGKATADSQITLVVNKGQMSSSVTITSQIESKGLRKGKLKNIEKTLNDLLRDSLTNTLSSESFIKLLK